MRKYFLENPLLNVFELLGWVIDSPVLDRIRHGQSSCLAGIRVLFLGSLKRLIQQRMRLKQLVQVGSFYSESKLQVAYASH